MIEIPDFSRAQDGKSYRLKGRTLKSLAKALSDLARGEHIETKGSGIFKRPGASSVALSTRRFGGSSGSTSASFPFEVSFRPDPSDPTKLQFRVEQESYLLLGDWVLSSNLVIRKLTTTTTIGGVTTIDEASWMPFQPGNDLIWVEVLFDDSGFPTDAQICSVGTGGTWNPDKGPGADQSDWGKGEGYFQWQSADDGSGNFIYAQVRGRRAIFSSTKVSGQTVNTQMLSQNLCLRPDVFYGTGDDGVTFIATFIQMPFPDTAPYIKGDPS